MELFEELLREDAYSHTVSKIEIIETHLSWVFLTGDFVYKLKKPVRFDFVDFSSLDRRKFFCEEELRCNVNYAPSIYLAVVPIVLTKDGQVRVAPDESEVGEVVEWAVQMRQFDISEQANALLQRDELTMKEIWSFGGRIGLQHIARPAYLELNDPVDQVKENFITMQALDCLESERGRLSVLEEYSLAEFDKHRETLQERHENGFTRECHGDLHLANVVRIHAELCAFDCLEFNEKLRNIDVWEDVAFLFMDLSFRGRDDLAYTFIDGYLNVTGDYSGASLLGLFAIHRAMVRATVSAIRCEQSSCEAITLCDKRAESLAYLKWGEREMNKPVGQLIAAH